MISGDDTFERKKDYFKQWQTIQSTLRLKSLPHFIVNDGIYFRQHIKLHSKQGHGFAAEFANDLIDRMFFRRAYITGGDNAKNGHDRIVNNIKIQSKYCQTAEATFNACFDEKKQFKYQDMQIEVPYEQYYQVREKFTEKGLNPDLVRQGHITYDSAKLIAQFGSINGLLYDTVQGVYVAIQGFTISSIILFAGYSLSGRDSIDKCALFSLKDSVSVFKLQLYSHIITQQLCRTGINTIFNSSIDKLLGKVFKPQTFVKLAERMSKQVPYQTLAPLTARMHLAKQIKGQSLFIFVIAMIQIRRTIIYNKNWKSIAKNCLNIVLSSIGSLLFSVYGSAHFEKFGQFVFSALGSMISSYVSKEIVDIIFLEYDFSKNNK